MMSLYDDYETTTQEKIQGWSSGIKLLQSQLQLKKASVTQPKRDQARKVSLAPVIDLKSKREEDEGLLPFTPRPDNRLPILSGPIGIYGSEFDWKVIDEYDPLWPNEYEKVVKEIRESRDKDIDRDRERERERERERDIERRKDRKRKSRFSEPDDSPPHQIPAVSTPQMSQPSIGSGFAGRWADDEEEEERPKPVRPTGGVAIAPPPSLQDTPAEASPIFPNKPQPTPYGGSVAAKIMARYGFKEGQGLGRMEQGMSSALQVEKTSKRGGRIVHEKDIMPPPPPVVDFPEKKDPPITEIMKNPSKVVLLKNMVGPGEVDDDLEPEVKDECNTKYGPVASCIIHEVPNVIPEETVRIFVEFQRIESAIKAVVDLNGRFFGGRLVKATFYDTEKFDNLQLMD
ncbi:splicing factor 45 [Euwallacea fornicatus]|uniref:splicing factor 45 n=1 Tax=Euwallacea fornicatus TaxID=995702 RepID=UPI00338EC8F8